MTILLDTNVVLRTAQPAHAHHSSAVRAVRVLRARGDLLCVVAQVLYEFWVVATRPVINGGFGWIPAVASQSVAAFEQSFDLFPDTADIYLNWKALVTVHQVSGKPAHDARLVAAMACHGRAIASSPVDLTRRAVSR